MEEKIFFANQKGIMLSGILTRPGKSLTSSIMILCHGFASSKNNTTYSVLAPKLMNAGIASFRFDFFGHGESEGDFADLTVSQSINDILAAIDFIKKKGYEKIGLMGSSFGGLSSIIAASKTNLLKFLVLKAPVSNYLELYKNKDINVIKKWEKNKYRTVEGKKLKYDFYLDSINNIGYKAAEKIHIPVLIIHGNLDKDVPVEQSINLSKIIDDCALEIVINANHSFSQQSHFRQMINSSLKYILIQFGQKTRPLP